MPIDYQALRINGVYQQDEAGRLMMRIKLPAGVSSCEQAQKIATLADRHAGGRLHLTCRGSIELHDLAYDDIESIRRDLAAVGLTSRGACGGAVRGVSCSTSFKPGFAEAQRLARRIHRYFTGNPFFEGLPKKFKIGVEAGYDGGRHLIQDVGLVITGQGDKQSIDVWVAGGLGVLPTPAFLLKKGQQESAILPLIESIIRVYALHTPPPKRLKYLLAKIGEEEFRKLLQLEEQKRLPLTVPLDDEPAPITEKSTGVECHFFAGELSAEELRRFTTTVAHFHGFLVVNADQNLVATSAPEDEDDLHTSLQKAGFDFAEEQVRFRVCPGTHECKRGLSPTRELAASLTKKLPEALQQKEFALAGCPNSCTQPQLAQYGISTSKLRKVAGEREPFFSLFVRSNDSFGEKVLKDVSWQEIEDYLVAVK